MCTKKENAKFNDFRFVLGYKLRLIRECKGYTHEEMAKKLGVSPATVQQYESGKETANLLYVLGAAKIGRVTVEDLAYMSKVEFMVKLTSVN